MKDSGWRAIRLVNSSQNKKTVARSKVVDALSIIVLTPKINSWLKENDPKALERATKALLGIEN